MAPSMGADLYQRFAAAAARHQQETALEVNDIALTYAGLQRAGDGVGQLLAAEHRTVPSRVGILAARSLPAYIGYLGALRLGATVVPLNPAFPVARNREIAAAARLDAVLADDEGSKQLAQLAADLTLTPVRLSDEDCLQARGEPPGMAGNPADMAYIMFTSGSTGKPKGVPVLHRNVCAYLDFVVPRYRIGPGCRLSQTFDLTFDPSVFDLFASWTSGATLVTPDRDELFAPVDYVNDRRLTHWLSVPSIVSFAQRLGQLQPGSMPSLQWSLFCGEQLTRKQAEGWMLAAPAGQLENLYGPTELTITCTCYALPGGTALPATENDTVPIGSPHPAMEALIVDGDLARAAAGELCLRGPQRFPGYLDPDENAGRFLIEHGGRGKSYDGSGPLTAEHWYRTGDRVRNAEGVLTHLGRIDHQVKILGHRIELQDVESALRRCPGTRDVAVVAAAGPDGERELVGAYTGEPVSAAELVERLSAELPSYMVPRRFLQLDEMPLNVNGKIDRIQLAKEASECAPEPGP